MFAHTMDQGIAATASGSWLTQVQVLAFAAIGAVHFRRAIPLFGRRKNLALAFAFILYLTWSVSSVLWSDEQALTLRRVGELALVGVGCVGIGGGYYGSRVDGLNLFAKHVLTAGLISAALLLCYSIPEFSIPRLLDPSWAIQDRAFFSEFTASNAYSVLSLAYLSCCFSKRMAVLGVPLLAAFLLTKSVTVGAACGVTALLLLYLVWNRRTSMGAVLATWGGVIGLSATLVVSYQSEGRVLASVMPALGFDTASGTTASLDGRIPLWNVVFQYLQAHRWEGYGFGAFWSPNRCLEIGRRIGWLAPAAHNGFLDEVLGTGAVGLTLLMLAWMAGLQRGLTLLLRGNLRGAGLIVCCMFMTLLYNCSTSVFQFSFTIPFFLPLIGLFAMLGRQAAGGRQPACSLRF